MRFKYFSVADAFFILSSGIILKFLKTCTKFDIKITVILLYGTHVQSFTA